MEYRVAARSGLGLALCVSGPRVFKTAGGLEVLVQDPFDLPVDAAEFIGSPLLQGLVGFFVDAQDKRFL